jgi:hypothetical protein
VPFGNGGNAIRRGSAWRGERDGLQFSVATGDETNVFDTTTICMMLFEGAVDLTAFLREIAVAQDSVNVQKTPQGSFAVFEIEDHRTGTIPVLVAANSDGRLIAWVLATRDTPRR